MWVDACATAADCDLLHWLYARVALPTKRANRLFVCLAAALRDQVPMLRWLTRHGLCVTQLPEHADMILASAGRIGALRYLLGACKSMRERVNTYDMTLAWVAAYNGRLVLLRWLHDSGVQRMDHAALRTALERDHRACVAYIQAALQRT